MRLIQDLAQLYLLVLIASKLCKAIPMREWSGQHLLGNPEAAVKAPPNPYTPRFRDPYDHKIDSVEHKLNPLPWLEGKGASVMGPQNRARQRQNPDLVRPPSTDNGGMANMRWSFADSHVRIEVSLKQSATRKSAKSNPRNRREVGLVRPLCESFLHPNNWQG